MGLASPGRAAASARFDLAATVTGTATAAKGKAAVTVGWRNAGPAAAGAVKLTYTPPLGTDVAAGGLPAGWTLAGRSAVRSLPKLAAAGSGSATIPVSVSAAAVPGLRVGGFFRVVGTGGTDTKPANNEATSRIRVAAAPKATPTPAPKATPTPKAAPKPTPKPTAKATVAPKATPKAAPKATVTPKATPEPAPGTTPGPTVQSAVSPTTTPAADPAGAPRQPTPTVSTHVATPPVAVQAVDTASIEVIDVPIVQRVAILPMVGALTCFTAAGLGGVVLHRRRLDARRDAQELSVELGREPDVVAERR